MPACPLASLPANFRAFGASLLMTPRRPWIYALIYMSISIGLEIFLMVVCRLKIPEDNKYIAAVLLTVAPVAAALLARYRAPKELISVILLSSGFTLLFVMIWLAAAAPAPTAKVAMD